MQPIITNLEGLRKWNLHWADLAPAPRALWSLELRYQGSVDQFLYSVRQAAFQASAARVLTPANGMILLRFASTLTVH